MPDKMNGEIENPQEPIPENERVEEVGCANLPGCLSPKLYFDALRKHFSLSVSLFLSLGVIQGQCTNNKRLRDEISSVRAELEEAHIDNLELMGELNQLAREANADNAANLAVIGLCASSLDTCNQSIVDLSRQLGYYQGALEECYQDAEPMDDLEGWSPESEELPEPPHPHAPNSGPSPLPNPQPQYNQKDGAAPTMPIIPLPPEPPVPQEVNPRIIPPKSPQIVAQL